MPDEPAYADRPKKSGPLAGLRVVEFAGIGPSPFAAMLLADMGADIIAIERPEPGPFQAGPVLSRGRPKVAADLKDPGQRDAALDLIAEADALVEGFRPGVMERLGLGPDVALSRNPRLVYGRMTGWGQTGPLAGAAGHDINYIALTGALAAIGPRERPLPPHNLLGDFGGGALYLVVGLLAAIISARRTGEGQVVDCAICDGTASLLAMATEFASQGRWRDEREANLLDGGAPFYRTFECADGKHVAIGALETQFYRTLCKLVGLDDPLFRHREQQDNWPELHKRMEAAFKTRTREEWRRLLEGTDACFAPVLTLGEAPQHPHLAQRRTFVEVDGIAQPAPAPRFSRTPAALHLRQQGLRSLADALAAWRAAPVEAA